MRQKKIFYLFIGFACCVGYLWLIYSLFFTSDTSGVEVCYFKNLTHLPCPSCGTTRGLMALAHGHWTEAFFWNPISILAALFLLISPFWLIYDAITGRSSFYLRYHQAEKTVQKKKWYLPLIILILLNWIWNFYKHL